MAHAQKQLDFFSALASAPRAKPVLVPVGSMPTGTVVREVGGGDVVIEQEVGGTRCYVAGSPSKGGNQLRKDDLVEVVAWRSCGREGGR
jgi:hypothetical protein